MLTVLDSRQIVRSALEEHWQTDTGKEQAYTYALHELKTCTSGVGLLRNWETLVSILVSNTKSGRIGHHVINLQKLHRPPALG